MAVSGLVLLMNTSGTRSGHNRKGMQWHTLTHTSVTGNPLSPQPRDRPVLLRNTGTERAKSSSPSPKLDISPSGVILAYRAEYTTSDFNPTGFGLIKFGKAPKSLFGVFHWVSMVDHSLTHTQARSCLVKSVHYAGQRPDF